MQSGPQHGGEHDAQQHRRKTHPDIDQPRDRRIQPAAEIACGKTENRAKQAGEQRGDERDNQRRACAIDQPGKDVASEAVGAKRDARVAARPHRCLKRIQQILLERVVR